MMRNYYYLVAGLPELLLDQERKDFSVNALKEEVKDNVHPSDYKLVEFLHLPYDNENFLNQLLKRGLEFSDMGNIEKSIFDELDDNIAELPQHELQSGELLMMTIRSHDQFNTTIYGMNDRYRGIYNERRVIFMNEKDIADNGLLAGSVVDLISDKDGIRREAHKFIVVPFSIPKKCTATYFPETNVLVPIGSVADKSNTPVSKSVVIKVVPTKH